MNAKIHNRAGELPADGWYQIEVTGEHPAGEGRTQVIDQAAMEAIVNRFQQDATAPNFAGLLVDADHLSHDLDNSTEALGWAQELSIRNGQLYARLELTDVGESAIRNKRYKFTSTEYDAPDIEDLGNGRVRPLRLAGLALTNRPNNRGAKPLSNRACKPTDSPIHNTANYMQNIAAKLNLPPEADEAAVITAIEALLAKVKTMEGKEASTEADAIMNRFGERIPADKRDDVKARLIANRADTEAMLELLPAPLAVVALAPERIFNRHTAGTPDAVADAKNDASNAQLACVTSIRNREKCSFDTAWQMAKGEKPELFR
ncbi:MAG: Mu-like prophage I protein [Verrucomicrobia bacterium]|nr:MAG: Mu-like prophage I protein [Verrucomicrobiota bacterium]